MQARHSSLPSTTAAQEGAGFESESHYDDECLHHRRLRTRRTGASERRLSRLHESVGHWESPPRTSRLLTSRDLRTAPFRSSDGKEVMQVGSLGMEDSDECLGRESSPNRGALPISDRPK